MTTTTTRPLNDRITSTLVGIRIHAQPSLCFRNAAFAVMYGGLPPGAMYVEGYAVLPAEISSGHPWAGIRTREAVPHGWVELEGGAVALDPSPGWDSLSGTAYFAAVRYTRGQVEQAYAEDPDPEGPWLPLADGPAPGGRFEQLDAFSAAREVAEAYASEIEPTRKSNSAGDDSL